MIALHQILFVDDDATFLETVAQLFIEWSKGAWQVHQATTTAKALAILEDHRIDLTVMDIQMPVMDGIQFLALLNRKYPMLRKVVMTGFPRDDYRANCLNSGAELFLEKPRTSEGYETVFATLNELVGMRPEEGFRGVMRQVGLSDLIQLECLKRNSSILEVVNGQVRGLIYIEQGAIVHAELGTAKGEAAFNQLLCLEGGEFHHKPFVAPSERSIEGQWEFLLMEAARMRDELAEFTSTMEEAAAESISSTSTTPAIRPKTETAMPSDMAVQTDEMVVCSGQDEVLYEWECCDIEKRLKLIRWIAAKAEKLERSFALGRFDRVEALEPRARVVVLIAPDQKTLVRCSPSTETVNPTHAN